MEKTPLFQIIKAEIDAKGPMPIDLYMEICLTHPEFGYYSTKISFGKEGDFVTSPEISQLFGETLGIFIANVLNQESVG